MSTRFSALLLPLAASAMAATIHVPSDYPTIQAGIEAAADGDLVLIANGTYTGAGNRDISFQGKAIEVRGAGGDVVVDAQFQGRGFIFSSGEGLGSVLSGITITHGQPRTDNYSGGGIRFIDGSSPLIDHCTIRYCRLAESPSGNDWGHCGGGVSVFSSDPVFEKCDFVHNSGMGDYLGEGYRGGGGALIAASHSTFRGCTFDSNTAGENSGCEGNGGAVYVAGQGPLFENCLFMHNRAFAGDYWYSGAGGAAYVREGANAEFVNCTFADNSASDSPWESGAGAALFCYSADVVVRNTIMTIGRGHALIIGDADVSYSCIHGESVPGPGNISDNPKLFEYVAGGYYYVMRRYSPCLDAGTGDNDGGDWCMVHPLYCEFNTELPDMGAYGGPGNAIWWY
jgi:hypothetical protein